MSFPFLSFPALMFAPSYFYSTILLHDSHNAMCPTSYILSCLPVSLLFSILNYSSSHHPPTQCHLHLTHHRASSLHSTGSAASPHPRTQARLSHALRRSSTGGYAVLQRYSRAAGDAGWEVAWDAEEGDEDEGLGGSKLGLLVEENVDWESVWSFSLPVTRARVAGGTQVCVYSSCMNLSSIKTGRYAHDCHDHPSDRQRLHRTLSSSFVNATQVYKLKLGPSRRQLCLPYPSTLATAIRQRCDDNCHRTMATTMGIITPRRPQ